MAGGGGRARAGPPHGTRPAKRCLPSLPSRSSGLFHEVAQMDFEIASSGSLSGTQRIAWQVEYPRRGTTGLAVSEVFVSRRALAGIVPLAMVRRARPRPPRARRPGRVPRPSCRAQDARRIVSLRAVTATCTVPAVVRAGSCGRFHGSLVRAAVPHATVSVTGQLFLL